MEDKDLFEVWKKNDQQENVVYEKHKEEYEQLVKKQSNDIFKKIRRNVLIEVYVTVVSFIFFVGALCYYYSIKNIPFYVFVFGFVLLFAVVVLSVWIYSKYLKDIELINEASIADSLKKKIRILSNYVKRLNLFYTLSFITGFVFGLCVGIKDKEFDLFRFLRFIGVSIPTIIVCIWLGKKYIHALYGKHLKNIKEVYNDLLEGN